MISHAFNLQSREWLEVSHAVGHPSLRTRQCQFSQTPTGLDLLVYSVPDHVQCNSSVTAVQSAHLPSLERYHVKNLSLVDAQISAEQRPGYPSSPVFLNKSMISHESWYGCNHSSSSGSQDVNTGLTLMISPGHHGEFSPNSTTAPTASHQWQLPLLKHFAWAVTANGVLFMDGGMTRTEGSGSMSVSSSASFLLGINDMWVKPLRGGSEAYAWAQQGAVSEGSPEPVIPSAFSLLDQAASQPSAPILILQDKNKTQHQRHDPLASMQVPLSRAR